MQIVGRTILVTGGASGLGGATSDMIVAEGGHVVILDINEETGKAAAARLGAAARFVRADVSSEGDVQRAVETAVAVFGAVHGAVNAAGIALAERVLGKEGVHPLDRFARVIHTNLIGTFNVIRLAAAAMANNVPTEAGERGVCQQRRVHVQGLELGFTEESDPIQVGTGSAHVVEKRADQAGLADLKVEAERRHLKFRRVVQAVAVPVCGE